MRPLAYKRKNEERHLSTQLQLTSITSNLSAVTTTTASLEDRMPVVNARRAILLQSKEVGLASGKRPVRLLASLSSFQRRKDVKDVKMLRLCKVGYLVSERRNTSFKDGEHL